MENPKINVIVKYFYPVAAGIETNIMETYSVLAEGGWDVTIHTSNVDYTKKGAGFLPEQEAIRNLKVKRYSLTPFGFIPNIDWSNTGFICLHNFDLFLHLHTLIKSLVLKLLGKKKFVLMLTPHGGFSPQWTVFPKWQVLIKKIYTYTLGTILINAVVDGIRSVSIWETKEMITKGITPSRIKTISNGLEYEAYMDIETLASKKIKAKVKKLGKYIIQIGRIYPIKNFETAIRALTKLPSEIKFAIVGPIQSKQYKKELDILIKKLGLERRVVFLGVIRGVDKYYLIKQAEAMVHMAVWEANCNVIHEAMSQKLLPIVSNTTGLANQIKDGVNGYGISVYDDDALAEKLNFVIKNKNSEIHQKMRAKNMKYVSQNSWKKVAKRMAAFYSQTERKGSIKKRIRKTRSSMDFLNLAAAGVLDLFMNKLRQTFLKVRHLFCLNKTRQILKSFSKFMKIKRFFTAVVVFILSVILLTGIIKGKKGNPIYHQFPEERNEEVGGPFESSGSTSRYALTEAIVESHTFFFNENRARFSAPDMVEYNGRFFSIFTPGVSFIGVPFYLIGKSFGLAQLFTYLSTMLFALLNVFLIGKLARKFGAGACASLLAGFIFLFATNALSYATTYTQHHASTAVILLALLNAFGQRTLFKNLLFGALVGIGLLFDIPNILMMMPIGLYILVQHFQVSKRRQVIKVNFKLSLISLIFGLIPFFVLFGWYNYQLTGSYIKIGQAIGRSDYFDRPEVKEQHRLEKEARDSYERKLPLNTRDQLHDLYILLVSDERGWVYYSPVVVVGLLGLLLGYKKRQKRHIIIVAIAVVLTTIVLYSMFGGSAGGWAFGPRYLIPATAILCASAGLALQRFKKNIAFLMLFSILSAYSIGVNVAGAITTTQVPPKVEAVNLTEPIPYTYEYNFQLLEENKIGSLIYNAYLSEAVSVKKFAYGYYLSALLLVGIATKALVLKKET